MKKRILWIVYSLLLCCTVTFAWILSGKPLAVPYVMLDYAEENQMFISSVGVNAKAYFRQGDQEVPAEDFYLDPSKLVPGTIIPFTITLDYQAQDEARSAISVKLSMIGITVSDPKLLDKMYVSVTPKNERLTSTNGRQTLYICLNEAEPMGEAGEETYRLNIYDSSNQLIIPHNDAGSAPSELDCYLYFDRSADSSFQNLSLDIRYFRLEQ